MKEKSQVTVDSSSDDQEKKGHQQEVVVTEGQTREFGFPSFLPFLPSFLLSLDALLILSFAFLSDSLSSSGSTGRGDRPEEPEAEASG